jgi:hypothetical protein
MRFGGIIMKFVGLFLPALLICLVIVQPASAYLDPGFGSMVWQMLVTIGFGVAFGIKLYWQKLKNFFSGNASKDSKE